MEPELDREVENYYLQMELVIDLSIVKIANLDPVMVGEEIEYTIEVFNAEPPEASNVKLTDVILGCILNLGSPIDVGFIGKPSISSGQ
ncbi:MAG: DUF11 domain-containing protein [Clostridiaceae bacterium]|nr:DUF11 domain-containing protein [Clostridiaceae bacterium]MBW4858486.1 DUF11 domain-containing protein [Clostridiaceae bacterium]MBW4868859.1 DUF11 domain-containing protein [Clostridiaceae bacterium]